MIPVEQQKEPSGAPRVRRTEHEAPVNLLTVLRLCMTQKLRCSEKTRRPSAATVSAVADVLDGGDFYPHDAIAAFAWPMLLQAGGLAQLTGGRLVLTTRGRAALTRPPHLTIPQLWQRWLNNSLLDEFSRVEEIKGQRSANVLSAAKPRRKLVGQALAGLTPGEWMSIDGLFTDMRAAGLNPVVHRSERALWKLYLEDPQYGSLGYDGHHGWSLLQGRYTLAVLFEYAATLGLIDIEYVPRRAPAMTTGTTGVATTSTSSAATTACPHSASIPWAPTPPASRATTPLPKTPARPSRRAASPSWRTSTSSPSTGCPPPTHFSWTLSPTGKPNGSGRSPPLLFCTPSTAGTPSTNSVATWTRPPRTPCPRPSPPCSMTLAVAPADSAMQVRPISSNARTRHWQPSSSATAACACCVPESASATLRSPPTVCRRSARPPWPWATRWPDGTRRAASGPL